MRAADLARLHAAYLAAHYQVRLAGGGRAVIRVGQPLPAALQPCLRESDAAWGIVTAWNPGSRRLPTTTNRQRQRELLARIRRDAPEVTIIPACNRAPAGGPTFATWREPSVFVGDVDIALLESWMTAFDQHAIVCGAADAVAALCWNPACLSQARRTPAAARHGHTDPRQ